MALLEDVLQAYPSAMIVQTHRPPLEVLVSSSSLHAKMFGAVSDRIDLPSIGAAQLELYKELLARNLASRLRMDGAKAGARSVYAIAQPFVRMFQADVAEVVPGNRLP